MFVFILPSRQANLVSLAENEISGAQVYRDGLPDSLRDPRALRIQGADQQLPVDRFANALQARDDRVQNLRTKGEPQFRIDVNDDLLPSLLRIAQTSQGQPAAFSLPEGVAKIKQERANAGDQRSVSASGANLWLFPSFFIHFFI